MLQTARNKNIPFILALNNSGTPLRWIDYERCVTYYTKDKILWSTGTSKIVLHGGTNALTGKQSELVLDPIVALRYATIPPYRKTEEQLTLTNERLFRRDKYTCAYCGTTNHQKGYMTRDHIIPVSKGGTDLWTNCVTACKTCNREKGSRDLENLGWSLLYVPYVPTIFEHLILQNRRILSDQMDFLKSKLPKNSRLL